MELDSNSNEADNEVENNKLMAIVEEIRTTKKYNKMHDYQDEVTMLLVLWKRVFWVMGLGGIHKKNKKINIIVYIIKYGDTQLFFIH